MTGESANGDVHRFAHQAMATTFTVLIAGGSAEQAGQAAHAAFTEIDRVEGALSRFIESSDVTQLNRAGAGTTVRLGVYGFECIEAAAQVHADTGGAFDVTIGPLLACWRNPDKSPRTPTEAELAAARACVGMSRLELDRATLSVRVGGDGMRVDLGGIGKGYALDQAAVILNDWDIESALISGGGSTVLALGPPPDEAGWPVGVGGSGNTVPTPWRIRLREQALSGSGLQQLGRHIFDPRTGRPTKGPRATWAVCPSAAVADALSTAFMVLSRDEVDRYCRDHADTFAMLLVERAGASRHHRFGDWEADLHLEERERD